VAKAPDKWQGRIFHFHPLTLLFRLLFCSFLYPSLPSLPLTPLRLFPLSSDNTRKETITFCISADEKVTHEELRQRTGIAHWTKRGTAGMLACYPIKQSRHDSFPDVCCRCEFDMMREIVVYRSPTIILYGQTCAMANGHTAVGRSVALKYLQV